MFNQITMNVYIDGSVIIVPRNITRMGNHGVDLFVTVDSSIKTLGIGADAQVHFHMPSGKTYYYGGYDCSDGSFHVPLGTTDILLSEDGEMEIQLVLYDAYGGLPEVG